MALDTITGALSATDTLGVEYIIHPQTQVKQVIGLQNELNKMIKEISANGGTITFTKNDGTTLTATIGTATTSANGLMTAADKTKLNGIETGAQKNTVTSVNGQTGAVTIQTGSNYTLPTASASTLGGVKVGTNLSINNGVLSATDTKYTLPAATSSVLGGVKVGSNITNSGGTISLTKSNVTDALGFTPSSVSGGVTGVKGSAESTYHTGNVNITAANVGAAASQHTHKADDIDIGILSVDHGGTGYNKAVSMRVYLEDEDWVQVFGNEDVTTRLAIGVNGVLSVAHGGTGSSFGAGCKPEFAGNLNELKSPGTYLVRTNRCTNYPSGADQYGVMTILSMDSISGVSTQALQFYATSSSNQTKLWCRQVLYNGSTVSSTYTAWHKIL